MKTALAALLAICIMVPPLQVASHEHPVPPHESLTPPELSEHLFRMAPEPEPVIPDEPLPWPVGGFLTQYFSFRHTGVDIAAPYGTGLAALGDGEVTAAGWVAVGGLHICALYDVNLTVCYYHLRATLIAVGQPVSQGQIIATIGLTGATTGPHVHWECLIWSLPVNCLAVRFHSLNPPARQ